MSTKTKNIGLTLRDICFISIFTAIIAVCAQLSIPMPAGVPFTLQTFAIPLAGIILGGKRGALSVIIYILLGIIGVPVFTGFRGGFSVLFGPTGGYIISFPVMALCAGISSDLCYKYKSWGKNIILASGLVSGSAINYIFGMLVGKAVVSCSWEQAFAIFVMPYIPTAVLKMILAGIIGLNIKKILLKNRILK